MKKDYTPSLEWGFTETQINECMGRNHHSITRTKGGKWIIEAFDPMRDYMKVFRLLQELNIRFELITPVEEPSDAT